MARERKVWVAVVMFAFSWVLWEGSTYLDSGPVWEVIDGYENRPDCHAARTERVRYYTGQKVLIHKFSREQRPLFVINVIKMNKQIKLYCLPGSVDPRPTK